MSRNAAPFTEIVFPNVRAPKPKAAARRSSPEYTLHCQVARYLEAALPLGVFYTTIGHGGGGRRRGAHLKRMGLRAGIPDVIIIAAGRAYWLEIKRPDRKGATKGKVSPAQELVHALLENAGCERPWIIRSLDDAARALRVWGLNPQASVAA